MPEILTIDHLSSKGDGVALRDGEPVYVPRVAAGDRVKATVTEGRGVQLGQLEEILEAGPGRSQPPCPHYEQCGGCQLQHLDEKTYQGWKESSVQELLSKAGITPATWLPTVFIPNATRRRVTFAAIKNGQTLTLGFNAYRSDKVTDLLSCLLLTPALDTIRDRMRAPLLKLLPEVALTDISLQDVDGALEMILTGDFGHLSGNRATALIETAHSLGLARIGWRPKAFAEAESLLDLYPVTKTFGKMIVEIPPAAFLQPSREGEIALTEAVLAGCKDLKKKKFLDLFAGCGTFTGPLLAKGSVHAVETDRPAVVALQKISGRNQGLSTEKRDLFKEPVTVRELNQYDCIVFDPPRAGAKAQCEVIAKSKVPRVIGVSCNPATFITDARVLLAGGYTLDTVQIIDQFIWSSHSEIVGVFSR
jgi:23S rRNA (uracil1939-C5)-methyltransferase